MGELIKVMMDENEIAVLAMEDSLNANTFRPEFMDEFLPAIDQIRHWKPKVLILAGTPDVFSAGASKQTLLDLCEGKMTAGELIVPERLLDLPFPVIAAMEGHAVGAGFIISLCCDVVIAALESRYGATFLSLGITPGMGCTGLLAELVGPFLAAEMMFTAGNFRGSELAKRATNINYIVPRSRVRSLAQELAVQIAQKNKETLSLLKSTLAMRKKSLLIHARLREDLMHRACFASASTRQTIEENYLER